MSTTSRVQVLARVSGVLYLIIIAAGLSAQVVRDRFVVAGNAAATASNITADAFLYRLSIVADLSTFVCAVALTVMLYALLRHVDRSAALCMLGFNVVQDAIGGLNVLNTYRPLQLLGNADYLQSFSRQQLEAMALLSLNTHAVGFAVALIFFGCSCLALGYLIYMSRVLPKAIGVLVAMAGVCYVTLCTAQLLSPQVASRLFPLILVPAFIGELSLAVWLTAKGVNVARWQSQRGHAHDSL